MPVSDPVTELRALLDQFVKSPCSDIFIRAGDMTVFMARPEGAPNPMREQPAPIVATEPELAVTAVTAPHLGLFEPACCVGDTIAVGDQLGVIDVLGRKTNVCAERAGRVTGLNAPAGDLVEYGDTLLELAAA